ncbi:MAG: haloacid dehalogenase type II [Gammaproteobacteria bacterium]|jgi:2-haloacid dehalogenase
MDVTLAFDVYGTLIDTNGVTRLLVSMIGDTAPDFSRLWRDKQLEYAFRRGLMRRYRDFGVCTRDALEFTNAFLKTELSGAQKQRLLDSYRSLPAFADVAPALQALEAAGYRLFAFSNGSAAAVGTLLESAGILARFVDIVSVDEIGTFKPDPDVYRHFLERSGVAGESAWLVSGNAFDIIGAVSAGMRAAWVRRKGDALFDPWDVEPTVTVNSLSGLQQAIRRYTG